MVHILLIVIYLSFISLGLPDALLGAAWPTMCGELLVPLSYAGGISLIISIHTVVSSLLAERMNRWLGTGKVTAISVGMTAFALLGFSLSREYWQLCLWAIPYGLGAGSVDASLNNYVAIHYASRHMSWLHCMWGLGASVGPYLMGLAISVGMGWAGGYRMIAILQFALTVLLVVSLPLWKRGNANAGDDPVHSQGIRKTIRMPGVKKAVLTFASYCGLEQSCMLWASSYLVLNGGMTEETAASCAGIYVLGIAVGRLLGGFLTMKFSDLTLVRLGQGMILSGILAMLLGGPALLPGLLLMGLGSAPIYPCMIHATPRHFGEDKSQAVIGLQSAGAFAGICCIPPLFGLIAQQIGVDLLPWYLLAILLAMTAVHESLIRT